ncbi:right-handed parallel beta-helix repeat-containing protein [Candidatus Micrarchaeota archaeon]|nr:right-handed parallel beta-helix repeat-containing protein [Candidatus Micrarchaeota archaeon]
MGNSAAAARNAAMSRAGFLKTVGTGAAAMGAIAAGFGGVAMAGKAPPPAYDRIVIGTGIPSVDVQAVQAAVDLGGTVLLKGTFDFGTDRGSQIIVPGRPAQPAVPGGDYQDRKGESTVFIYNRDVKILGESDADGNPLTVIKNGAPTFWIGWDGITHRAPPSAVFGVELFPVDQYGNIYGGTQLRFYQPYWPEVSIEGISFEHPIFRAFGVGACKGFTCRGNQVTDAAYELMNINGLADSPIQYSAGAGGCVSVFVAPFVFPPQIHPFLPPGFEWIPPVEGIVGNIVIEDNVFENMGVVNTIPAATIPNEFVGTGVLFSNAASINISKNRMKNLGLGRPMEHGFGILCNDNFPTSNNDAAIINISKNSVENSAGFGVQDYQVYAEIPGAVISGNDFTNCFVGVQVLDKSGTVIKNNRITNVAFTGIWLSSYYGLPGARNCYIGQNKIAGTSMFGAIIGGPSIMGGQESNGSGNVFVGNEVAYLATPPFPYGATYYLSVNTASNVINGDAGSVINLGTDNFITGVTPMSGAPQLGTQMAEAAKKVRDYRLAFPKQQ